ncbi:MAG: hypothetical protein DI635_10925 [Pseudoxanthomonas suwonensis]|nr:MAG: hypothetical protein DI635_10925 [Pseudoxanthomonas suwonensis]
MRDLPPRRDTISAYHRWQPAVVVVILATAVYWYTTGMQRGALSVPLSYDGDSLQYGYIIQSFAHSGGLSDIGNAGAPFGTQNVDFPNGDLGNLTLAALLFAGGYGLGFNLFLLLSVALTAFSGYAIALRCRLTPRAAFLTALAFALLPFHFQRIGHLFYTNYTAAAVSLWLSLRLVSPLLDRSRKGIRQATGLLVIGLACAWCATTGVYYAFFTCIVLATAALVQSARTKSFHPGLRAAAMIALIVLCTTAQLLPTALNNRQNGPNAQVGKRSMVESELYALKISQMLLPVHAHRLDFAAKARESYDSQALNVNENGTSTLGALGSAGFLIALLMLFVPNLRERFPPSQQLCAVLAAVLTLYATMGGFGSLFALFVSPQIRSINRLSPFIALFSLIVAAGTLQMVWHHVVERRPHWRSATPTLLVALSVLVVLDQVSPSFRQSRELRETTAKRYADDYAFARKLASMLQPGSRVMQLPYTPYPEAPDPLGSYTQFRNSLHAPDLDWSHGAMRGRPEANWLAEISALPPDAFVDVIQALGFSALVLDKRAFSQQMGEVQSAYARRTTALTFNDAGNTQIAMFPTKPPAATARAVAVDRNWYPMEALEQRRWIWSSDRPSLALSRADPGAGSCSMTLALSSLKPTGMKLVDEHGQVLSRASLRPDDLSMVTITVQPTARRLYIEHDVPAALPGNGDSRALAILWERIPEQLPLCHYQPKYDGL